MHIFAWSPNPYAPKYRRRPMVTPVHRFQRIESMLIDPRGRYDASHSRCGRARRFGSRPRISRSDEEEALRTRIPETQTDPSGPQNTEENSNGTSARGSEASAPTQPHHNTLPNNFNRFRMGGANWGLWICLIFITALLVPAHLFLRKHDYRGEVVGVLFVITLLFIVCFSMSMFHTKTRAILLHRLHLEDDLSACPSDLNTRSPSHRRNHLLAASSFGQRRGCRSSRRPVRTSRSTPDLQLNGESRTCFSTAGQSHNTSRNRVPRSMSQTSRSSAHSGTLTSEGGRSDVSPVSDAGGEPPPYELAILLPSTFPAVTPTSIDPDRCSETPPPPYDIIQ